MNEPKLTIRPLSEALRDTRHALLAEQPPAELQARIRAALHPIRTAASQPVGRRLDGAGPRSPALPWAWSGATLALCLLAGLALWLARPVAAVPERGFVPVLPFERWPPGPAPAWLVDTELQGERLAALGLPYDPMRAGDAVRAQLLLHPSGEVLAVRLID